MNRLPRMFSRMFLLVALWTLAGAIGITPTTVLAQRGQRGSPAPAASPAATPDTGTSSSRPDAFWRGSLPGGVYLVALRSIVSISSHEYVVDGAARVTEVTIATASTVEARFYYLEPVSLNGSSSLPTASLQQLQQHVTDLATGQSPIGGDAWQKVIKTYPTTTHAHTVEYRLNTKADLQSIYTSLENAWTTGKGVNFSIEGAPTTD